MRVRSGELHVKRDAREEAIGRIPTRVEDEPVGPGVETLRELPDAPVGIGDSARDGLAVALDLNAHAWCGFSGRRIEHVGRK